MLDYFRQLISKPVLESREVIFKRLFKRRFNSQTIKYSMRSEFAIYELVHVTRDPQTHIPLYRLKHCATGHDIVVDESIFNILFKRED